jgi:hypothetical protein
MCDIDLTGETKFDVLGRLFSTMTKVRAMPFLLKIKTNLNNIFN